MKLLPTDYIDIAKKVISGESLDQETCLALAGVQEDSVFFMMAGANLIRDHFFGNTVHLCTICNGKSGRCSEDCRFCSQSGFAGTDIDVYPLLGKKELRKGAIEASGTGINRYSIVTSGKRLPEDEVKKVADAIASLEKDSNLSYCVSLGILGPEDFKILKDAGVSRYHHNLETAESHFENICTTHTFQQRVDTIKAASAAGMEICAGGLFGMGETDLQVLELARALSKLSVDAVPVNFLTAIKGTRMADVDELTPLRCLKIIALFRYILPSQDILICGGRMNNLKTLHPMIFHAGASGIMTGRYLTTSGNQLEDDLEMIRQLGFALRE